MTPLNRRANWKCLPLLVLVVLLGLPYASCFAQAQHGDEKSFPPRSMGALLLQMGQYKPASDIYTKLFHSEPEDPEVVRGFVKSHAGMGKLESAISGLEDYLKEHEDSSAVLYGMGLAFYIQQKSREAEGYLERALEKDSKNGVALNTLAVVRYDQKRFAEALPLLKRAVEVRPNDFLIYQNLWRTYKAMDKTDDYLKEFENAKQKGPHAVALGYGRAYATSLRQEGFGFYKKGDRKAALEKMRAMLDVYRQINHQPGEVSALFSLGLLEEEEGNKMEARRHYEELLKISPNHIQGRQRLQDLK